MTRHLSFSRVPHDGSKIVENICYANRLRTFLPLDTSDFAHNDWMSSTLMHELFSKCKFFRVLSLSGCFIVNELLDNIGNLKHLRYLDLSETTIKKLPDSLCSLYNLQTLKLKNCWYLEELPLNLHKLANLRYLDFSGTKVRKMLIGVGKLRNLQVLSSFYVDNSNNANIQQLGELNLHETLSISELQNVVNPSDALKANLKTKLHLVKLELEWNSNSDNSEKERKVLEKLQPSKHLNELSIRNYGGTRFPDWFGDNLLLNVVFLELVNCENCVLLPPLGILPFLKVLRIIGLSGIVVIGSEFYGPHGTNSSSTIPPFPSLQTLLFENMKGWEEWDCKTVTSVFPCLQDLSIRNCANLKECLPEQLLRLMKLEISNCKQLVASVSFAPSIHELCLINSGKLQFDYQLSTLRVLTIARYCMKGSLLEWVEHTLSHNNSLNLLSLVILECPTMNIPLGCCYNFLTYLSITSSCDSLRTFSLDFFPKLQCLNLQNCSNLEIISQEHAHDHSLTSLTIRECPNFVSFPKGGFSAPSLKYFVIRNLENLKSLPESMHTLFPSLKTLTIDNCPQLESFSDGGLPSTIELMQLHGCSELLIASLKWALGINTSLKYLSIQEVDVEYFPDQGLLPPSLKHLYICNFVNLKNLNYKGLCHLSSLEDLYLTNCPSLQCLPVEGLPKSISTLVIQNCLSLAQRCKKPKGEDCGKISHIHFVLIDDDVIIT